LQRNETITEFDLEDNCIGAEGAVYIAEALQENTCITHLVGLLTSIINDNEKLFMNIECHNERKRGHSLFTIIEGVWK